jgi:hypothetical protein
VVRVVVKVVEAKVVVEVAPVAFVVLLLLTYVEAHLMQYL